MMHDHPAPLGSRVRAPGLAAVRPGDGVADRPRAHQRAVRREPHEDVHGPWTLQQDHRHREVGRQGFRLGQRGDRRRRRVDRHRGAGARRAPADGRLLDVAKYPTITFKSVKIEPAGPGKLRMTGNLTIRGVTKPVVLDVAGPSEPVKGPDGAMRVGASATTTIDRRDFGLSVEPRDSRRAACSWATGRHHDRHRDREARRGGPGSRGRQ